MDETADHHTENGPSPECEKTELKNDTKQKVSLADSSKEEGTSANTYASNEGEDVTPVKAADEGALGQDVQELDNPAPAEGAADSEPGDTATSESGEGRGDEPQPPTGNNMPTNKDFEECEGPEMKPLVGEPLSRELSVIFEANDSKDGLPKLDLESPERETTSPVQEEADDEEETAASLPVEEDVDYDEYAELLRQLQAEKEEASQRHSKLQVKLVEYFRKKMWDDARPEKAKPVSDQELRCEYTVILDDLWRHTTNLEIAQQQAGELRSQNQDESGQPVVEHERRALMAAERNVAVTALSQRLGKQAAQDKVDQIQESEQHREHEGGRVRLENIKLKRKIRKLEASLFAKAELADGTSPVDCEQLKVENQEFKDRIDKRNDELLKLRRKITGTVEVLTHVKEKLQWSQTENQAKRTQLAKAEAVVATERDLLTRTKQARDDLRVDKLKLRRRRGLLENRNLLWDFEDTSGAVDVLEEGLGGLRHWYAENVPKPAGRKGKPEQAEAASTTLGEK